MGQYYYLDGQTPIGPFSLRDVYTLLDREVVNSATLVCREGGADWQELVAVHELTGKTRVRSSTVRDISGDAATSSDPSAEGSSRRRRRGTSSASIEAPQNRLINLNVLIIAILFSVVAIYVTYTIGHANQEISIDQMADTPPSK